MSKVIDEKINEWLDGVKLINDWRITDNGNTIQFQRRTSDGIFEMIDINPVLLTIFEISTYIDGDDIYDYERELASFGYVINDNRCLIGCGGEMYDEDTSLFLAAECYMETVILTEGIQHPFDTMEDLSKTITKLGLTS